MPLPTTRSTPGPAPTASSPGDQPPAHGAGGRGDGGDGLGRPPRRAGAADLGRGRHRGRVPRRQRSPPSASRTCAGLCLDPALRREGRLGRCQPGWRSEPVLGGGGRRSCPGSGPGATWPRLSTGSRADFARIAEPAGSRCAPVGGSGMGAARLGQTASDAVSVTVRRSLTCADAVTWPVWPVEHCVRIEGGSAVRLLDPSWRRAGAGMNPTLNMDRGPPHLPKALRCLNAYSSLSHKPEAVSRGEIERSASLERPSLRWSWRCGAVTRP